MDCFQFDFLPRQSHNRSVRFEEGSAAAAAIASHDYRIAHASGKSDARHLETQLLHTLKKSGLKFESNPALPISAEDFSPPRRVPRSGKKHHAPPPPPPPPAVIVAKAEGRPNLPLKAPVPASVPAKGIE